MEFVQKIIKTVLVLLLLVGLPSSWLVFNDLLQQVRTTSASAIAASKLKHKKEIIRLKAKHKKEIAQLKLKHQKNLAKAKIKERSKRLVSAIPIIGTASLWWTGKEEYQDYQQWLKNNPQGTAEEYAIFKGRLLLEP